MNYDEFRTLWYIARVRKGKQEYRVTLAEPEFIDPDSSSAEGLAMFRYWLG